uniref:hypothetical protein n=1 Tax=Nonomuraea sp. CA-251285 TaxID=3240002 RepID=UPI003F496BA5
MDLSPYDHTIAIFRAYSSLDMPWHTTAVLGPLASWRLRRAVRCARSSGAVVQHDCRRLGLLTRYHRITSHGEGGQLLVLPLTLALLLAGRA